MAKRGRKPKEDREVIKAECYQLGYNDFCQHKKLIDCQYPIFTPAGKSYRAGWYQAHKEDNLTNPILNSTTKKG